MKKCLACLMLCFGLCVVVGCSEETDMGEITSKETEDAIRADMEARTKAYSESRTQEERPGS